MTAPQTAGEMARRFREGLSGQNIPRPEPPASSTRTPVLMPSSPEADRHLARYEAMKTRNPIAAANFHRAHFNDIESAKRAREAAAAAAPVAPAAVAPQPTIPEPPQSHFDALDAAYRRDRAAREG